MKGAKALTVLSAAALAVAYFASRAKNTVDQITYFIYSLKYNKRNSNLLRSELLLTLSINNPTTTTVSFDGFNGVLKVQGQTLASASTNAVFEGISIKPGDNKVTLPVIINHLQAGATIVSILKSLFNGIAKPLAVDVTGSLNIANLQIPLQQNIVLNIGQNVAGIGKARVSLEFANNAEAEKYFQKRAVITPTIVRRNNKNNRGFSLNGIGSCSNGCGVGSVNLYAI